MNDRNKNIKPLKAPDDPSQLFAGKAIAWEKSREEIWGELEKKLGTKDKKIRTLYPAPLKYVAAAAIILFAGIAIIMQFYVKTISIPAGQHAAVVLPDKSKVTLNAQTYISYKPLKWIFTRQVIMEGEAFFEVEPGKKFEVISKMGTTMVMGTSFNIYSRDTVYEVSCLSGKVKVQNTERFESKVITPGEKVTLTPAGTLNSVIETDVHESVSWLDKRLSFTSAPLKLVFEEIGRQYDVNLELPKEIDHKYTGTFRNDIPVEQALNIVCRPFNLNYSRISENEYIISKDSTVNSF